MVKLKSIPYITCDDVEQMTGKDWDEFEFAQMAEDGSYQILCCADWYLEELYEDLEDTKWEMEGVDMNSKFNRKNCYPVRIKNQIDLIEILRKQYGCRDTVLVYVCW